jgi:hypothetical protein
MGLFPVISRGIFEPGPAFAVQDQKIDKIEKQNKQNLS